MHYRYYLWVLLIFFFLHQPAKSAPTVRVSLKDAMEFSKSLTSVSKQAHITLVCENQPLHLTVTKEKAKAFDFARLEAGVSVEDAVTQIADVYDYNVISLAPKIPNCYLLIKRYTSQEDIPYITLDEITNTLEQIVNITSFADIETSSSISLHKFWKSLSGEQRDAAIQGIPVRQLRPDQQDSLRQFSLGLVFNAHQYLRRLARRIKLIHAPEAHFIPHCPLPLEKGLILPGYEVPTGSKNEFLTVILGEWYLTTTGGVSSSNLSGNKYVRRENNKLSGRILNPEDEPTNPRNPIPLPPPVITHTIAEVAKWANNRLSNGEGEFKSVIVAPDIAEKPVFLVGEEYLSPVDVVKAVGEVYELPVLFSRERHTVRVALPVGHLSPETTDIRSEVEHLLPAPYRHAAATAILHNNNPDLPDDIFKEYARNSPVVALTPLNRVVVRRVREIIEPLMTKRKDKILPMSEAPAEARNLIALSGILMAAHYLTEAGNPIPPFVTHFNEATVQMTGDSADKRKAFASVSYHGTDGKESGVSISIIFAEDQYYPQ